MDIKYLEKLGAYPSIKSKNTNNVFLLKPLPESEIVDLERSYNKSTTFPVALRELLQLSGGDCYVLDYGTNDLQSEMQESSRRHLTRVGKTIDRPFYVIDVFNEGDQFIFVYLDEEQDPIVYEAILYPDTSDAWIHNLANSIRLSAYIDSGVDKLLNGHNPF